ncbi:MAG: hypothetical protein NTW67_00305 [Candidatus Woesearchaeota archaeon]|nr:hypothetical protein [Candidatus Woesearchaeota archaeon]
MHRRIIICTIVIFAVLAIFVYAQNVGCCCDPVLFNGSYDTQTNCAAKAFLFIGPPPNIQTTCSQHCNATRPSATAPRCGDSICQTTENATTCPADCAIITGCDSPNYNPAPTNFYIAPVKGQKALRLNFNLPCPANSITIGRCKGDCTNFQTIATIPPATTFKDEDPTLEFNTDYTYSVVAQYNLAGNSIPATAKGNAGDLECWQQQGQFCLNYYSYDQYYDYLITNGYGQYRAEDFERIFGRTVNLTFGTLFNKGYQCTDANKLADLSPAVSCTKNQYCIADEQGPRCVEKTPCTTGDPFGLFATATSCETGLLTRYCFYDKSATTANRCYSCDPRMTCYDYKSKETCERDNCGAGDCQWNDVFDDLGTGVCIDKRYNNCKLCSTNGTKGMEITKAMSAIWDVCREEKSDALSNVLYPCFYDADRKTSKTCDESTCADYTPPQCGSPEGGIKLNPDNSIAIPSTDTCEIGVCQYNDITGCIKNADGNTASDCRYGDKACEQDHYPPTTTLIPTGYAGRVDFINIRIFDKKNSTSPPLDNAGKTGYKTYLCIKNATTTCDDARTFSITTSATRLSLKNTALKEGNQTLGRLKSGNNTIAFYSRDYANNLEIIQETDIYACENCSPPQLVNLTVTGGRVIGNKIYTSSTKPTFTFTFDEPTQVTFAEIMREGESVQLSQLTTGMTEVHEFTPVTTLLGTYNFTVNGHNDKSIYFDAPELKYQLIVDPDLAGLSIIPEDQSITNKTTIDIILNFTRPASLDKVTLVLDNYADPYAVTEISRDITKLFTTTNNQTFTAKVGNITGGQYTIIVEATGFNTLEIYKQSTFFVATVKPGIRLTYPTFGVTAYSVFNSTVETPIPSECRYVFDTPTAPNAADYEFLNTYEGAGTIHTTSGLSIPYGSQEAHPLHVYCKFEQFGIIQRSFSITLDPEPPVLITAFAEPAIIAEPYIPDQELYSTTLKAQIDKPGFCKYSIAASNFGLMDGKFPGYDRTPKTSVAADVNVTEQKTYQYWVACKAKNQLTTAPKQVTFTVDLTLPLNVTSSTPYGFGALNFSIGVVANKRVYCYFGENQEDTTKPMGAGTASYVQRQQITVTSPGEYTYYIKCAHVSGEQSDIIEIPVFIDTTPPEMKAVDDSGLPSEPDITWSKSKIKVAFRAEDPESGISHYLITLKEATGNKIIFKDYISNVTTGEPIYISTTTSGTPFLLTNGKQYKFIVKAVNKVGLLSEPMESDGVTVDTSKIPPTCQDGEQDEDETDIDCGGSCDGCSEDKKCSLDVDCTTNYCEDGRCKSASCEDEVLNGLESDVDCGGEPCEKCENFKVCIDSTNCVSEYCDLRNEVCIDAPPCADKKLTTGETDIDCGGPCEPCGEGKSCIENNDCTEGMNCTTDTKVCAGPTAEEEAPVMLEEITVVEEETSLMWLLYLLFLILAVGGILVGAIIILAKERKKPEALFKPEIKPEMLKPADLERLHRFAKKEEIPDKEWITLEKEIKKKHVPYTSALEKLRKIARKEALSEEPLARLKTLLDHLNEYERTQILIKIKLWREGKLTKEEIEELLRKLRITAEYYKLHREEFEKELEEYGHKKKH